MNEERQSAESQIVMDQIFYTCHISVTCILAPKWLTTVENTKNCWKVIVTSFRAAETSVSET